MKIDRTKPAVIVIFGASGDLTQRKLIPALYNLFRKKRLPKDLRIIGFARRSYDDVIFRGILQEGVRKFAADVYQEDIWLEFSRQITYFQGNLTNQEDFEKLKGELAVIRKTEMRWLYYLATAPKFYAQISNALGKCELNQEIRCSRNIVIEKPFGTDLETANQLNQIVHENFKESQVYRIDHYLGKENSSEYFVLPFRQHDF